MPTQADWYTKNSARGYPFDAAATMRDDDGEFIDESLLVDLSLRFDGDIESELFLSYAKLTEKYVSVAFSRTLPEVETVAALTLSLDQFQEDEIYPLVSSQDGSSLGVVVFGDLRSLRPVEHRCSSSQQSLIQGSVYYASPSRQADSLRRPRFGYIGAGQDLPSITLVGGGEVSVKKEQLMLDGAEREAYVFSLVDNLAAFPDADGNSPGGVLDAYVTPCGRRPESRTCEDPQPIEALAGVSPDCCGRVFIEFRGCGEMLPLADRCGVMIDCPLSTDETCPPSNQLPDEDGKLPNEFPDDCDNSGPTRSEQDDNVREYVENPPPGSRHDYRNFW